MTGTIFDIQRFSVHDGPGIRTTVFMKGCPLRCKWCHNPEGLSRSIQLQYFEEACIQCGRCGGSRKLEDAQRCPSEALKICGRQVEVDELVKEILKDRVFYGNTGGVTFSGGECLLQPEFVSAALVAAKAEGLHCSVDTSGFVPWSAFEMTLDVCDLYLYDIKCMDAERHKLFTGVDNRLILENIRRLSRFGKEIWVRVPVIPGFNNTQIEMESIADFVQTLNSVSNVTLIPYHNLGAGKYTTLGLNYPYDTQLKISEAEMEVYRNIFTDRHIRLN